MALIFGGSALAGRSADATSVASPLSKTAGVAVTGSAAVVVFFVSGLPASALAVTALISCCVASAKLLCEFPADGGVTTTLGPEVVSVDGGSAAGGAAGAAAEASGDVIVVVGSVLAATVVSRFDNVTITIWICMWYLLSVVAAADVAS